VICALLPVAACTRAEAPAATDWASRAEAWIAAFDAAWATGASNAARFYAPDLRVDHRGMSGYEGGRDGFLQFAREGVGVLPSIADEPAYLATSGMVHPVTYRLWDELDIPEAPVHTIAAAGITREVFAGSVTAGEELGAVPRRASEPTVRAYLDAWASGDPDAIRARYAAEAELSDTIAGIAVEGADVIAGLAAASTGAGSLQGVALRTLPDGKGPAWYVNGPLPRDVDTLVVLLDLPGECPGPLAVHLRLDEHGLIAREERFHRVDALRRCLPAGRHLHGWWDSAALPTAPPVARTGTSPVAAQGIVIWNGSGRHEGLLRWALQRFAGAGLPLRAPTSVTFLPDVCDPWRTYALSTGSNAPDIGVSIQRPGACPAPDCRWPAAAKHAMLHELAHLWLTPSPYLGIPQRVPAGRTGRDWAAAQGLVWDDQALPWEQRAGERAAEILAWGLMDGPDHIDARLGNPSCAALALDFRTLTHTTPDPRACPSANDTEQASAHSCETTTTTG
jgi:hypothetical protein